MALLIAGLLVAGHCDATVGDDPDPDEILPFDATRPLLSLHGPARQNKVDQLDDVLAGLLAPDASGKRLPLVVYVHGRGNEPHKSFHDSTSWFLRHTRWGKGQVLAKIEDDDVRALGFNWDSHTDDNACGRPIDRARAAGPAFAAFLLRLRDYRAANSGVWGDRKAVLLVHSMGGFVLQAAVREPGVSDVVKDLFDIRLITGSDVPAKDHSTWIPVGPPGATVIASNPHDKTLNRSLGCDHKSASAAIAESDKGPRLGMLSTEPSERAQYATYVVLDVGGSHRTFTRGGADGNVDACGFMESLMRGRIPAIASSWRVSPQDDTLLDIKRHRGGETRCSAAGADDDDGGG